MVSVIPVKQVFLVDSHCHLDDKGFEGLNVTDIIARAVNAGVTHMVTINTQLNELSEVRSIAHQYPNIFYSAGIHPHHADTFNPNQFPVEEWIKDPKWIGLGETGLDYYYDNAPRDEQKASFKAHLEAAEKYDIPIIVHTRSADEDTVSMINDHSKARGVIHCFSGSKWLAEECLKRGFYLSFSGIITFKKSDELREIVTSTPLNRILVETDAPYLAPLPHRGKTNEPAHTYINAQWVADIHKISLEEVARITTQNFQNLFNRAQL